jgi:hypothetical protein
MLESREPLDRQLLWRGSGARLPLALRLSVDVLFAALGRRTQKVRARATTNLAAPARRRSSQVSSVPRIPGKRMASPSPARADRHDHNCLTAPVAALVQADHLWGYRGICKGYTRRATLYIVFRV